MTVSLRQWRAKKTDQVQRTEFVVFGWKVLKHVMPVGSRLVTYSKGVIQRAVAPNLTYYVRGRATTQLPDGSFIVDRVPGMYSGDRPPAPIGETVLTAVEELEFWCFNWHANGGALPVLQVFALSDGQPLVAEPGQRTVLCCGTLGNHEPGVGFMYDGQALHSEGDSYGFFLESSHG